MTTKYSTDEIAKVIKNRPNKAIIDYGQECYRKNMLHLRGDGVDGAIKHISHFENEDIFKVRKEYAVSNVDLFCRLLQEEQQVYTTVGGSVTIGGAPSADVGKYTAGLRKWMQKTGYNAYNADPMGLFFVEHDGAQHTVVYKCISSVWDYKNIGRQLEYVCFAIDKNEYAAYSFSSVMMEASGDGKYYRWVDSEQDVVVKYENERATIVDNNSVKPIVNKFGRVPGFIISDIPDFTNGDKFLSRIYPIIELADCFLKDRSIEELQKAYHGFAKAVEPFLQCSICAGEGNLGGKPCPSCTPAGADRGTGYKLRTKVADVSRFPLSMLQDVNFDFRKIFGYVTPDIDSMEWQNKALYALEALMYRTHWGSVTPAKAEFNGTQDIVDTATKVLEDKQPKRAVLNTLADWDENAEAMLLDLIVQFYTGKKPTSVCVSLNRDYILNTPEEILYVIHDMKKNFDAPNMIDAVTMQYLRATYRNDPNAFTIESKKYLVNPFPNDNPSTIEGSQYVSEMDKLATRNFRTWAQSINPADWLGKTVEDLRKDMYSFCSKIKIEPTEAEPKTA